MKFSVLVASYNNGRYFKDFYDSIIKQTYTDWEVVIVDDCSTDGSIRIIEALINDDPRFRLFSNEKNFGCGYTKRKCAEQANGELSGFVDPDDTIVPEAVSLMVNAHKKYPDSSLIHATFYYCDEFLNQTGIYNIADFVEVSDRFTNLEAKVTAFASFKTDAFKRTSGIDPTLLRAVDQDLYLKLSEQGSFHFINKPLYNYRLHHGGIATANTDKAFYWFLKVIAKAEERRNVNLEGEIASYLNRTDPKNVEINLANPRYLILQLVKAFKTKPSRSLKKLFFGR